MGVIHVLEPKTTAREQPDPDLACTTFPARTEKIPATVDEAFLTNTIPEDARRLVPPAEPAPGVELLACRLPDTAEEGGILRLVTW